MKHLYVHIPFCRSRCAYCDFASEPLAPHTRAGRVERYLQALREELDFRLGVLARTVSGSGSEDVVAPAREGPPPGGAVVDRRVPGLRSAPSPAAESLETIYMGGGTPTVLPADALVALVQDLAARARAQSAPADTALPTGARPVGDAPTVSAATALEFTVEANPGTIDAPLLERLAGASATRLSLGVQSFSPGLRRALARRVGRSELDAALAAIAGAGWREWNLDLVFGIPGQTWDAASADLEAAIAAGPTHISLYDLTYTPRFLDRLEATVGAGARRAAGAFAEQHYAAAVARLEAAGYRRYEVSNFALPGHECRHNQAYWRGEDYVGVGAAAVSTVGLERRTNPVSVMDYLAGMPPETEVVSPGVRLWERAMLGLRTLEGVDEAAVLPVLDEAARDRLLAQGCLERRHGKIRINPGYLDVSNTVIGTLLADPNGSRSTDSG